MNILITVIAAIAGGWFLYRMSMRANAEFQRRMLEIHELRVRAWRKRMQATEADSAAAGSLVAESALLGRRAADLLAELRSSHGDDGASYASAYAGHLDDDLAELQSLTADLRIPAAAEDARRRLARASHDAAVTARVSGGTIEWREPLLRGAIGAAFGVLLAFGVLPTWGRWSSHRYGYVSGHHSSLDSFLVAPAPGVLVLLVIVCVVLAAALPPGWWEPFWRHPKWSLAVIGLSLVTLYCNRPRENAATNAVLDRLAAQGQCPRPIPRVRASKLALTPMRQCALVMRARAVLTDADFTHVFIVNGDTAGIEVASIENAPTFIGRGRGPYWRVGFVASGTSDPVYWVRINQHTGMPFAGLERIGPR